MTNLEKYKELAEKYYNRDEKTKNILEIRL